MGAELTIIERQSGEGVYWKNIDVNITLHANAVYTITDFFVKKIRFVL